MAFASIGPALRPALLIDFSRALRLKDIRESVRMLSSAHSADRGSILVSSDLVPQFFTWRGLSHLVLLKREPMVELLLQPPFLAGPAGNRQAFSVKINKAPIRWDVGEDVLAARFVGRHEESGQAP
jgi:hypothetical protein